MDRNDLDAKTVFSKKTTENISLYNFIRCDSSIFTPISGIVIALATHIAIQSLGLAE